MADTRLVDSTVAATLKSTLDGTELLRAVHDPGGTPVSRKTRVSDVKDYILGLANTWTATQTITPAANTSALSVSGFSLTGSNAQSLLDLAGTWNTSGTPTAIDLNITDTASNSSSLLLNLRTGGTSRFKVSKTGVGTLAAELNCVGFNAGGGNIVTSSSAYIGIVSGGFFQAVATNVIGVWGSSLTNGGALAFTEMTAPSAGASNTVRLYAQDNGSGKTQLMALFASGAAQQVAIEP